MPSCGTLRLVGPAGGDLRKLSARPRSAARAALCCRCVSSRSVPGLLGPGAEGCDLLAGRGLGGPAGGDLRKLSARPRSAARAALCCRCVSSRSVPGLLGPGAEGCDLLAGRGLGGPAGGDLRKLSARPRSGPVRPCAAGASLPRPLGAGGGRLRPVRRSWPICACRSGLPVAICASCRPGLGLRPVRPCAAGASLAGLSPASWGRGRKAATCLQVVA